VYQCGRDSHLRGRFVRYPSVSISPTLSINEKVEQHIRKKIHKPNVLRFWVEGGVVPLYVMWLISHSCLSPKVSPSDLPNKLLGCFSPCESQTYYVLVCL